jgi:hypothetical protein
MCLDFVLELPLERSRGNVSARRLADVSGLHVTSLRMPSGQRGFQFGQGGKGCSCSLLGEDFEIGATSWPLDPGVGAALARAISLVATLSPSFVLDSTYARREPEPERFPPRSLRCSKSFP